MFSDRRVKRNEILSDDISYIDNSHKRSRYTKYIVTHIEKVLVIKEKNGFCKKIFKLRDCIIRCGFSLQNKYISLEQIYILMALIFRT
jgi:hypothetical protein